MAKILIVEDERPIREQITRGLEACGWQVDQAQDGRDGETPLHRAITRGQTATARLLIESGCDLNIGRTRDGDTPLDMAEGRGRTEIAELLREKGAKKSSDLPSIK